MNYPHAVIFESIPPLIPDTVDMKLLQIIARDTGKVTTTEMAEKVNKGQSTVSVRLKRLVEAGYIAKDGH
ncbi:MAG: winged helix-turn-helix transcriptional regulator [Candidatus Hodarchaeales archaeon]